MNIAIYIKDFKPESGGACSIVSAVVDEIVNHIYEKDSKNKYFFFGHKHDIDYFKSKYNNKINKNDIIVIKQNKTVWKYFHAVKFYSELMRRLFNFESYVQKQLLKKDISLVWYVGTSGAEVLDIPYACVLWDLNHLVQPYYPELSSNNIWLDREVFYRYFLKRASIVFTGTEVGKQELIHYYNLCPSNIVVNRFPSLLKGSNSYKSFDINTEAEDSYGEYLIYPAQFWPHKNHITLLHALRIVHEKYKLKLNLVLTGSDQGNMKFVYDNVLQMGLSKYVYFTGYVSEDKLSCLYRNAIAMIYPSSCGPDNLPPLEAYRMGLPTICANVSGAHEQYGDASLLVDVYNEEEYARQIYRLYRDKELKEKLINYGYEKIKELTVTNYVNKSLYVFDDFMKIRRNWL